MRRFSTFVMAMMCFSASAQQLEYKRFDYAEGYSLYAIYPTINNLIKLLSLSEREFVSTMRNYRYKEDTSNSKYISYTNLNVDNLLYVKAGTTFCYCTYRKEIRCFVPYSCVFPKDVITNMYRSMRPYYVKSLSGNNGNSVEVFSFGQVGNTYELQITTIQSGGENIYDITLLNKVGNASKNDLGTATERNNSHVLHGSWFQPHNAGHNIKLYKNGQFCYSPDCFNCSKQYGTYSLSNGKVKMIFSSGKTLILNYGKIDATDNNYYLYKSKTDNQYFFIKGEVN